MRLIFVYGTLKRGGSNHSQLAAEKYVGDAFTRPGFRLYELDGFPGMVAFPDDHHGVSGEVWSVTADCLARLDVFEGVPEGLYRRERIALMPPFDREIVDAYLYAQPVTGRRDLGSSWT